MKPTRQGQIAILSGFVFILVLSMIGDSLLRAAMPGAFDADGRTSSTGALVIMLVYAGIFAIVGCYICARRAPSGPMFHALCLGLAGLCLLVPATIILWYRAPVWYNVLSLLLVMPYAWAGGRIREIELERSSRANPGLAT